MVWILIVLLGLLPRELTYAAQAGLTEDPAWYVDVDGGLDLRKLLSACQTFFREHSEHWSQRFQYQEAWPQLLLQAFLHRIVNGGGRIEREYGLGRGRTDLLIVWPRRGGKSGAGRSRAGGHRVGGGEAARVDEIVIECKVLHGSLERTISEGLEQTAAYMDRCAAAAGHLVVIDRAPGKRWDEKVFQRRMTSRHGVAIDVWGM